MRNVLLRDEKRILLWSIVCRLATVALILASSRFVHPFDDSGRIAIPSDRPTLDSLVLPFVQWDTIHFLEIAQNGYTTEQQFAFMPGMPWLLRLAAICTHGMSAFSETWAILIIVILVNAISIVLPLLLYK